MALPLLAVLWDQPGELMTIGMHVIDGVVSSTSGQVTAVLLTG